MGDGYRFHLKSFRSAKKISRSFRSWPHLVADAGASHLHRSCPELLPELVLGDFDSAQPEILESYRERWDPKVGIWIYWSITWDKS